MTTGYKHTAGITMQSLILSRIALHKEWNTIFNDFLQWAMFSAKAKQNFTIAS